MKRENFSSIEEMLRAYNQRALSAGKELLSEQTGFIHYHYHLAGTAQTIPIFENFLFAYALLKNKSVETIQQAKELLNKLLYFQCNENDFSSGNFPIYLHEYPICKDRYISLNLLPVFYWILSQFNSVLGKELSNKINESIEKMIDHALQAVNEPTFSYLHRIRLSSFLNAYGKFSGDKTFIEQAVLLLENSDTNQAHNEWYSPEALGELFVSLQLIGPSLVHSGWKDLWEHLCITYSSQTATYIGPCFQCYYWEREPQITLYDFCMASCTLNYPNRLDGNAIAQLHATLIQPHNNSIPIKNTPHKKTGTLNGTKWSMYSDALYSVSMLEHEANKQDSLWKGILPMQLCFAEEESLISLVAQGGNYQVLSGDMEKSETRLLYQLSDTVDVEHKEEKKEIILSITRADEIDILVNGEKSNIFKLNDKITLRTKERLITVVMKQTKGNGRFIGHIMPGNRASQLAVKEDNRFNAYDWQLFLRTLSRSEDCHIEVDLVLN